ncbi:uncharacterized protein N7473_009978 [Penicillium subrubescens]|uniref:uncharacterized protein n=1 Tax=Penicillium subrubescens TaxID=1316194 RepID=UPI0025458E14|nr:uncharacterized protein N7473_009978 [Penicillium subrubescens]KAJ5883092.1 hypothetical protein N7473_009978 [Penicillium subrubescens]
MCSARKDTAVVFGMFSSRARPKEYIWTYVTPLANARMVLSAARLLAWLATPTRPVVQMTADMLQMRSSRENASRHEKR